MFLKAEPALEFSQERCPALTDMRELLADICQCDSTRQELTKANRGGTAEA
jgi:hypothetical protein